MYCSCIKQGWLYSQFSRRDIPIEDVRHMSVDVTDEASVQSAVEQILLERGSIEILDLSGFDHLITYIVAFKNKLISLSYSKIFDILLQ